MHIKTDELETIKEMTRTKIMNNFFFNLVDRIKVSFKDFSKHVDENTEFDRLYKTYETNGFKKKRPSYVHITQKI